MLQTRGMVDRARKAITRALQASTLRRRCREPDDSHWMKPLQPDLSNCWRFVTFGVGRLKKQAIFKEVATSYEREHGPDGRRSCGRA